MGTGWLSGLMMRYHSRSLVQSDVSLVVTENTMLAIWELSSNEASNELVAVRSRGKLCILIYAPKQPVTPSLFHGPNGKIKC